MTDVPATVRYLVDDVTISVAFYVNLLGFTLENNAAPTLASVRKGMLNLVLVGPAATGARPAADGTRQTPGGWNRILLPVADLPAEVERLRKADVARQRAVDDGQREVDRLKADRERLQSEREQLKTEADRLKAERERLRTDLERLRSIDIREAPRR